MTREEQVASFRRDGYLAVDGVFSDGEVERLRASLAALEQRARGQPESTDRLKLTLFGAGVGDRAVQQIAEPHEIDGTWMDLAADPRILDLVEALIGPNILLYYSMLMMKPARSGAPAPWHQDLAFFVHDRARLVACQVYLDDSTAENGCIRVVPGSHRLGF
jgi:ectoine hydroxylase-related dioxygenase (phytanoyl-CoA dioxygenase family)